MFSKFVMILILFTSFSIEAKTNQWYAISNESGKCEKIDSPDKVVAEAKRLNMEVSRQRNDFSTGLSMESVMFNETLIVFFSSKQYCQNTLNSLRE